MVFSSIWALTNVHLNFFLNSKIDSQHFHIYFIFLCLCGIAAISSSLFAFRFFLLSSSLEVNSCLVLRSRRLPSCFSLFASRLCPLVSFIRSPQPFYALLCLFQSVCVFSVMVFIILMHSPNCRAFTHHLHPNRIFQDYCESPGQEF